MYIKSYFFIIFSCTYLNASSPRVNLDELDTLIKENTEAATKEGVYAGFQHKDRGQLILNEICALLYKDLNIIITHNKKKYSAHTSELIVPLATILLNHLPEDESYQEGYFSEVYSHLATAIEIHKFEFASEKTLNSSTKFPNSWKNYRIKDNSW